MSPKARGTRNARDRCDLPPSLSVSHANLASAAALRFVGMFFLLVVQKAARPRGRQQQQQREKREINKENKPFKTQIAS